jgi:outer membrane protein assembly factor BamB
MCIDADSGKVLWSRTHSPFAIDGLPDEQVERLDTLLEVSEAIEMLLALFTLKGIGDGATEAALKDKHPVDYCAEKMKEMRSLVEAADSELLPAFDATAAVLGQIDRAKPSIKKPRVPTFMGFAHAIDKKYDVRSTLPYRDYAGTAMPTPCSDGKHVYAVFSDGQTVCYTLDGKRVWWKRFPVENAAHRWANHYGIIASPQLVGDRLVVAYKVAIRAFDKRTGKVLWEQNSGNSGGWRQCDFKVLQVSDGKGSVPVLVWQDGKVRRVDSGEQIGSTEAYVFRRAMVGAGDRVLGQVKGGRGGKEIPLGWQRISIGGDGKLVCDAFSAFSGLPGRNPGYCTDTVTDRLVLREGLIWDHTTGKQVYGSPQKGPVRYSRFEPLVVAGRFAIVPGGEGGHGGGATPPPGADTVGKYAVLDLSNPAEPKLVATNHLGGPKDEHKPRVPVMEKHLPELYAAHGYGHNAIPYKFAPYYSGGVFASGNRLFIATTAKLYCIGDPDVPYDGRDPGK